jgi:mannose-6-phosphate isomerase
MKHDINIDRTFVDKPWGGEDWLINNDHYVAKHLYINPKEEISLQYHNEKHETMIVLDGMGTLIIGEEGDTEVHVKHCASITITQGDIIPIPPKTIHQIKAITNLKILEISTPQTTDLVRVADKYDRN